MVSSQHYEHPRKKSETPACKRSTCQTRISKSGVAFYPWFKWLVDFFPINQSAATGQKSAVVWWKLGIQFITICVLKNPSTIGEGVWYQNNVWGILIYWLCPNHGAPFKSNISNMLYVSTFVQNHGCNLESGMPELVQRNMSPKQIFAGKTTVSNKNIDLNHSESNIIYNRDPMRVFFQDVMTWLSRGGGLRPSPKRAW